MLDSDLAITLLKYAAVGAFGGIIILAVQAGFLPNKYDYVPYDMFLRHEDKVEAHLIRIEEKIDKGLK